MGIPGLTKFINSDRFLRPYELKDTYLIIDGNNVMCHLYRWYTNTSSAFGGDYDVFYQVVREFFLNLIKCKVKPIVIFDGGIEEKKLTTIRKRTIDKLTLLKQWNSHQISGTCQSEVIFPLLLYLVFCNVLEELDILKVQCFFEADREIAALARYFGCPVLSYDSDFYLFDVLYIPFDTLNIDLRGSKSDYHLHCYIYDPNVFTEEFEGFDKSLLPLIAALLGNDYVDKGMFRHFFNHVIIPHSSKTSYSQRRILGLINWLKNESLESAVNYIVGHIKKASVNAAKKVIYSTIDDYTVRAPVILSLLNEKESQKPLIYIEHELILRLPQRFIQLYQQCKLSSCLIDIINLKRYYVKIQVEDVTKPNSQIISFPILSAIHKILTSLTDESFELVIYLRKYKHLSKQILDNPVEKCFSGIDLKNIMAESKEVKEKIIFSILSMTELDIKILSGFDNWKLFMISLIFWLKNAQVTSAHLHSIFIMVIANYVQSKVGHYKNYMCFMKQRAGSINRLSKVKIKEIKSGENSFSVILKAIKEIELLKFTQKFIKLRGKETPKMKNFYVISTIHLFAEFQSVLLHVSLLNALMDFPYPEIKFSAFYSGTLLYNLYYVLSKKSNFVPFLHTHLSEMPNIKLLYDYLAEKLSSYIPVQ